MNRDNQQETASEAEKAWLAGFIDGEGSLSIGNLKSKKTVALSPRLSIPNTDKANIAKVCAILDKILVSGHLEKKETRNEKWKTCYIIYVTYREKLKILLETIIPYLAGKKKRAELILKFIDSRLEHNKGRRQEIIFGTVNGRKGKIVGSIRHDKYTEEEWEIVREVSILNQKGRGGDPQRLDANLQRKMRGRGMKIKSDPSGDTGKSAEMTDSFLRKSEGM